MSTLAQLLAAQVQAFKQTSDVVHVKRALELFYEANPSKRPTIIVPKAVQVTLYEDEVALYTA